MLRRELRDDASGGARAAAAEGLANARAEGGAEGGFALGHAVLEDDAADDDGDGGGEVADEAEGSGRGGDVLRFDKRLQGDERSLEIGADAESGNKLEDDGAGPGFVVGEVDEEAKTEGHEEHAEPDGREVLARFLDEDADAHGGEGEGDNEGEEVDS